MVDSKFTTNELKEAALLSWEFCPAGEPIPGKTYRADGWFYLDIPGKFTPEIWEKTLSWIGEEQFHMLILSKGSDANGPWVRGQLIVSPQGMLNLAGATKPDN